MSNLAESGWRRHKGLWSWGRIIVKLILLQSSNDNCGLVLVYDYGLWSELFKTVHTGQRILSLSRDFHFGPAKVRCQIQPLGGDEGGEGNKIIKDESSTVENLLVMFWVSVIYPLSVLPNSLLFEVTLPVSLLFQVCLSCLTLSCLRSPFLSLSCFKSVCPKSVLPKPVLFEVNHACVCRVSSFILHFRTLGTFLVFTKCSLLSGIMVCRSGIIFFWKNWIIFFAFQGSFPVKKVKVMVNGQSSNSWFETPVTPETPRLPSLRDSQNYETPKKCCISRLQFCFPFFWYQLIEWMYVFELSWC